MACRECEMGLTERTGAKVTEFVMGTLGGGSDGEEEEEKEEEARTISSPSRRTTKRRKFAVGEIEEGIVDSWSTTRRCRSVDEIFERRRDRVIRGVGGDRKRRRAHFPERNPSSTAQGTAETVDRSPWKPKRTGGEYLLERCDTVKVAGRECPVALGINEDCILRDTTG